MICLAFIVYLWSLSIAGRMLVCAADKTIDSAAFLSIPAGIQLGGQRSEVLNAQFHELTKLHFKLISIHLVKTGKLPV